MLLGGAAPFLALALVPGGYLCGSGAALGELAGLAVALAALEAAFGMAAPSTKVHRPGDQLYSSTQYDTPSLLLWAYVPSQLAILAWGAVLAADTSRDFIAPALLAGVVAGIFGMMAAHELVHSRRRAERALGIVMLGALSYLHFRIAHVHGHHRLAATPEDPATARRGESAYGFVLRSVAGQFRQALEYERQRTRSLPWSFLCNRVNAYVAATAAFHLSVGLLLGWRAVAFLGTVALTAIFILEMFNYVAHYGMERRILAGGRREPLADCHSWNAPQRFSSWAFVNGGLHSHHHREPARAFRALVPDTVLPVLPAGLAGSILLALVPPLWRLVMDSRLDAVVIQPATG